MFKDYFIKVLKKSSILTQMKEKKEAEDKQEFKRLLKHGKPEPKRNTRPPFRLETRGGPPR